MRAHLHKVLLLALCAACLSCSAAAQNVEGGVPDEPQPQVGSSAAPPAEGAAAVTLRSTPLNILRDQQAIWTSPAHLHEHNFAFLVPLGLATAAAITADHQIMASARLNDPSLNSHASTASNGLLGAFAVAPAAIYSLGRLHNDAHASETGILAGEAMVDSLVVDEVLKAATMRERPTLDGAKGRFFQTSVGLDSSFPSTHSIVAWSSAAVLASEYNNRLAQIGVYGLATGVSVTRVLARQHFPSDVLIGSAFGWMVGRYVFHKHHRDVDDE